MGMYTELNIAVQFKPDAPKAVLDALHIMARERTPKLAMEDKPQVPAEVANHPLFKTDRWDWMLRSGGSAYFDAEPFLSWKYEYGTWRLTLCTNIKNYTGEWEYFLDFIAPHLYTQGYIGTYRYEESDAPELLYAQDGKIIRVDMESPS